MRYLRIFITLSIVLYSTNGFCQFEKKHLEKIPDEFSKEYLITYEFESGRRLSYSSFKNGDFVCASENEINNFMNTMLLGSATYLFDYLKSKYPTFSPEVVKANGFTSTTFYIKYKFDKGEIFIIRIMTKNKFLSDPLAAENPGNYSLLYAYKFEKQDDQKEIEDFIKNYAFENQMKIENLNK